MQKVSQAYKNSMKSHLRNRAYIKATVGIINSEAQDNVRADKEKNNFTYFSNNEKIFTGYTVDKVYATAENDFTKTDGSMYFLPTEDENIDFYNNGAISNTLNGTFYVDFKETYGHDIKGLTIDFGEYYPTSFTVEWDKGSNQYTNNSSLFITEDVFNNVSYFKITAISMVNGNGRLRIYQFSCGISKTFSNNDVINYRLIDYVSPITETIPSQDMTLEVDNQNLELRIKKQKKENKNIYVKDVLIESFGVSAENGQKVAQRCCVINELINNKNRVLEQNFALKECEDGVYDIEDEDLLIEMGDLEISKYKSRLFEDGVTLVYAESPRGFAKGICENKASKLPKSFIDYQKLSSGSFNIVSNLEFFYNYSGNIYFSLTFYQKRDIIQS